MGGILGLCTGFSIITGVEFFYWFTARIMVDHCTRHKKISPKSPKDGEEEPKEDCQQCAKLECKMKLLEKELRKQKEANRKEMETIKKQMEQQQLETQKQFEKLLKSKQ